MNGARRKISSLKAAIEQHRIGMAARGETEESDREEERLKETIEREKMGYKENFARLRELKKEIEHLHMLLEQSKHRLQSDFESWLQLMVRQQKENPKGIASQQEALDSRLQNGKGGNVSFQSTYTVSRQEISMGNSASSGGMSAGGQGVGGHPNAPVLTGNSEADADILAFYRTKQKLMKARAS